MLILAADISLSFDRLTPIRRLATATFHGLLGHALANADPDAVPRFFKPGHDGDDICPYVLQPLHLREHMAESLTLRLVTFDPAGECMHRFLNALPACVNRSFGDSGALVSAASHTGITRVVRNHNDGFHTGAVICVTLISPSIITHHKKPVNPAEFSLPIFLNAALRRLSQLNNTFGFSYTPPADMLDLLGNAHLGPLHLRWVAPRRRSTTQDTTISMGGLAGSFHIHHATRSLWDTLVLLNLTNIGKKTSCGCGTLTSRILS